MNERSEKSTSKFLSLILRHKPGTIGLALDEHGWADTAELLEKINAHNHPLTLDALKTIVANNDKKRFVFSEDYGMIRANQGHSVDVDLQLREMVPPGELYHGTAEKNMDSIRNMGLVKGTRHHVHLSADRETAHKVGMRYGKPVVLIIDAKQMHADGSSFYQSENGVWLVDMVAPKYLLGIMNKEF